MRAGPGPPRRCPKEGKHSALLGPAPSRWKGPRARGTSVPAPWHRAPSSRMWGIAVSEMCLLKAAAPAARSQPPTRSRLRVPRALTSGALGAPRVLTRTPRTPPSLCSIITGFMTCSLFGARDPPAASPSDESPPVARLHACLLASAPSKPACRRFGAPPRGPDCTLRCRRLQDA
jgi:hypothetical protein